MSNREHRRGGAVVGPVILIGLGIIFLLNNLGYLDWNVWEIIFRLWPIMLVAVGLDLLFGRYSIWGSLLAVVLTFAVLGLALWLSAMDVRVGRTTRTQNIVHPLDEVTQAELLIRPGVGRVSIQAAADAADLVEGTVYLAHEESLSHRFDVEDGRASLVLETERGAFGPFAVAWGRERSWELQLSPDVSWEVETDLGIGQQNLDLTGLNVADLQVSLGIGQSTITLPAEGRFNAQIEGGIGETVVVIPETLGARVLLDTGISGRRLPPGYVCEDDVCLSPNYDTVDHRVELDVSQGIGSLVIRH